VPFWNQSFEVSRWIEHLKTNYDPTTGLDLYLHIPYCESLCYYCGCHRVVTKNHSVEGELVDGILKEWNLYKKLLGFTPKIGSLHLGGGTPTFLSALSLRRLIEGFDERTEQFIGSIEVDPRTCSTKHIKVLLDQNIKRVSLGIQDFDENVQQAIHRFQSPKMVKELVQVFRESGFDSINFDLIYGLPRQTISSIEKTMEIVTELKPDLLAFYSYAHLPEKIKNQRLIKEEELPQGTQKRALYERGKELLAVNGYQDVGMDHFALQESFLYQAKKNQRLQRNFMGYVDKKSSVLLGLGPSSISDSGSSFAQNAKSMKDYLLRLAVQELPIDKGHLHSKEELIIQKVIQDLMCKEEVDIEIATRVPHWDQIMNELKDFESEGLVYLRDDRISLSPIGRAFMRNVAMSFDSHLRHQKERSKGFSQTV